MRQQAPEKGFRRTLGHGAAVTHKQIVERRRGRRSLAQLGQFEQKCPLLLGAALKIEHQRPALLVQAVKCSDPFLAGQQAHPQHPHQWLEGAIGRHAGQGRRRLLEVRRVQHQRLEDAPQVAVRRAEGDRLKLLGHGGVVAAGAGGERRLGRGPMAQQRAVRSQRREGAVRGDQGGSGELCLQLRLRLGRQPRRAGQQAQRLVGLSGLQQPVQVGPIDQRRAAHVGARAPQRQRFLDQALRRQLRGAPGVGRCQAFNPLGAPLALEPLLVLLDRLLVTRRAQGRVSIAWKRRAGRRGRRGQSLGVSSLARHGIESGGQR